MKKNVLFAVLILVLFMVSGCATSHGNATKRSLSGHIGCHPSEIVVLEDHSGFLTVEPYWVVECRGVTYFCSTGSNGKTCTESQ